VDTRDTPEQAELRRSARRLARALGPAAVPDLDDPTRGARLASAVREAGWLELRDDAGAGAPAGGGVEAAIVADALGSRVADTAFLGPVLAADLARRAGSPGGSRAVVGFAPALTQAAMVEGSTTTTPIYALDPGRGIERAAVLVPEAEGVRVAYVAFEPPPVENEGADLTRAVISIASGTPVIAGDDARRLLTDDDLAAWTALGLALTSADLVGVMRGVLDLSVEYAAQRRQFGVPVGSFQAVQHLLADAHCLMEGATSVARHASWAVDNLDPRAARSAGRVAKAYCARAARTVCETAVQVHGGIGNTWDCMVHVYLRRALLSAQWFGDDAEQLAELQCERLGAPVGLP
jgi:alkylation response protein AidB-like acyl-CoA dehydrogenase